MILLEEVALRPTCLEHQSDGRDLGDGLAFLAKPRNARTLGTHGFDDGSAPW